MRRNAYIFESISFDIDDFFELAKLLAYFVVPNEYGMNDRLKLETSHNIGAPLLEKILSDLLFWKDKKF